LKIGTPEPVSRTGWSVAAPRPDDRETDHDCTRHRKQKAQYLAMNPYAKPNEPKIGAKRPKISHLPAEVDSRTRKERLAEKQAVVAERRAIKKSARQHLKQKMLSDLQEL